MTDLATVIELLDRLTQPGADPAHPSVPRWQVATARMDDAQRGHPGSSMGGGGGRGGSPVEAALDQPDIGGEALAEWRHALAHLDAAVRRLDRLAEAWTPRAPSPSALRETEMANRKVCEHCDDGPLRADAPTDVRGNLAEPIRLCRWCYDYTVSVGRLPDARTLERRRKGQRIRVAV